MDLRCAGGIFDDDGSPLPGAKTAPFWDVFLGQHDFEMEKAVAVTVRSASVSKEAFQRLEESNFRYFVNVYSGRRVFAKNILACTHADGRIADLQPGKRIEIH